MKFWIGVCIGNIVFTAFCFYVLFSMRQMPPSRVKWIGSPIVVQGNKTGIIAYIEIGVREDGLWVVYQISKDLDGHPPA